MFFFVFGNCFVANSASEEVICEKMILLLLKQRCKNTKKFMSYILNL